MLNIRLSGVEAEKSNSCCSGNVRHGCVAMCHVCLICTTISHLCTHARRYHRVCGEFVLHHKNQFIHRIFTQDFHSLSLDFTKSFQLREPSIPICRLIVSKLLMFVKIYVHTHFFIPCAMFEKVFLRYCTHLLYILYSLF